MVVRVVDDVAKIVDRIFLQKKLEETVIRVSSNSGNKKNILFNKNYLNIVELQNVIVDDFGVGIDIFVVNFLNTKKGEINPIKMREGKVYNVDDLNNKDSVKDIEMSKK